MNEARPIRIITSEDDQVRMQRAARGARIDKLGVDRSRYAGLPLGAWSVEAQASEPAFEALRAEVTMSERIAAWRAFFAMTRR